MEEKSRKITIYQARPELETVLKIVWDTVDSFGLTLTELVQFFLLF